MMTCVQEEIPKCSPGTSPRKQEKAHSTSRPQFRSENIFAPFEADQISLALKQLASYSNPANFNNNINQVCKMPKSLTTAKPTFDGKFEKFESFEDLFQRNLKTLNKAD